MPSTLSHLDESGRTRMVDIGHKPDTERLAIAKGEVHMRPETLALIQAGALEKGDVLTVAQLAGVMAAKRVIFLQLTNCFITVTVQTLSGLSPTLG